MVHLLLTSIGSVGNYTMAQKLPHTHSPCRSHTATHYSNQNGLAYCEQTGVVASADGIGVDPKKHSSQFST